MTPVYENFGEEFPEVAFYADVYFRPDHLSEGDKDKYLYARKVYDYIHMLLGDEVKKENIYLLDLHPQEPDPYPPKGKETLITELGAYMGLTDIHYALRECPNIKTVVAMGAQVNRWLQLFKFYWSGRGIIEGLRPDGIKVVDKNPFYLAETPESFDKIVYKAYSLLEISI